MITFQDLLAVGEDEKKRAAFVNSTIASYKVSDDYEIAKVADDYDRCRNTTIMNYQKTITTLTGETVEDRWSATHRSTSNFFHAFVTQLTQYLLANGANLSESTRKVLGSDIDTKIQDLGQNALCSGVSYGFFNLDHVDVFSALEFIPLFDEENGGLAAGIRFWRLSESKPLRAKLYEQDGFTSYLFMVPRKGQSDPEGWAKLEKGVYYKDKEPYRSTVIRTEAEGEEIIPGEPYPSFPIIPMYGNRHHQSLLVGLREKIDAFDFILNGFEDDLDNAQIYWMIQGAAGMDDPDLIQFLERLKAVHAAAPGNGQSVSPVQVEIPYNAREKLLDRLSWQLYRDAMILNPDDIAGGANTATQIRAAYERQNVRADEFEYCVLDFLHKLFKVAEVEDEPTFNRSSVINQSEEISNIVTVAQYLPSDYVTRKVLTIMGDGDKADEIIKQMEDDERARMMAALQQAGIDVNAEV